MPEPGLGRTRTGLALAHDSAVGHVTGEARYTDDLPEPVGCLHAAIGWAAEPAHGRILRLDLAPVRAHPGVVAVASAADVPGVNDVGAVVADEPLFATDTIHFAGQPLFAVAALDRQTARRAARAFRLEAEPLPAILTIDDALAAGSRLQPAYAMARGEPGPALAAAPLVLDGSVTIGGQEHFYLEGQVALAVPGEAQQMLVTSSTQHPSEVQHLVARVLGVPDAAVTVEVRRMGGGFGGKETQAGFVAATAALLARMTGRPVKLRLDRDDDVQLTGKRHDFRIDWRAGVEPDGLIRAVEIGQAARGGWATDLTPAICDRAMFHADNAYFFPAVRITSERLRTHTQSATAFRGFGGPQGMLGCEVMLDTIARRLGLDPLDVRRRNLYGPAPRDLTPYHQRVHDNVLPELLGELEASAQYRARRRAIDAFNRASPVLKRGLALTPVKFGISFTTTHLNQAGALLHLYTDGSLHLAHGGTEMGQGLHQKILQLVADELQLPEARIRIATTTTAQVPNTSATAASSGSDLNGAAALDAARTLKARLVAFLADRHGVPPHAIVFRDGHIQTGSAVLSWAEVAKTAHAARVPLSATGFYATPAIHWDRACGRGRPFLYFAYGAACAEVAIDTATGETRLLRADLLHDAGRSLNPAIDRGQVEGGFVQGMGWLTSEELVWDERGRLRTHSPSTYKIPTASDVPADLRVTLWAKGRNVERVVGRSKAVGEPPLMLAIAVFLAIRDAIAACGDGRESPDLDAPATPERVLAAVTALRARTGQRRAAE